MIFIETPVFTRQVKEALADDDYRLLQLLLAIRPEVGDVIKGGGGIRKVRWALPGRGKSGGMRVIYYWRTTEAHLYMLFMFPKNQRSDLTSDQVKQLAKYVKELK